MNDEPLDLASVAPGETQQFELHIARLPSGNTVSMRVFVIKGQEEGPALLLSGGLHGDEVNGIEIIRRYMEDKSCHPTAGTIVAIPILNIYGFLNYARELPDGKDANRSFPGTRSGSLASRVAHHLTKKILPVIDYGMDFHTGGSSRSNYPQVRCHFEDEAAYRLAHYFAAPFIINSSTIPGSLRHEASKLGKSFIVYEGGQALRFSETAIEEALHGIKRVMHHLKLLSGENSPAVHEPVIIGKTTWLRADVAGLFRSYITEGQYIEVNHLIGMITDPYNEYQVAIHSPVNGYVIGLNHSPVINAGDALVHMGLEETH